jgi:hypothetical protein
MKNNRTSTGEIKRLMGMKDYYPKRIIHPSPTRDYFYKVEGRPFTLYTYWQLQELGIEDEKITHKIHRREVR